MGNVLTIGSQTFTSTIAGPSITYTYDKLNRLSTLFKGLLWRFVYYKKNLPVNIS